MNVKRQHEHYRESQGMPEGGRKGRETSGGSSREVVASRGSSRDSFNDNRGQHMQMLYWDDGRGRGVSPVYWEEYNNGRVTSSAYDDTYREGSRQLSGSRDRGRGLHDNVSPRRHAPHSVSITPTPCTALYHAMHYTKPCHECRPI